MSSREELADDVVTGEGSQFSGARLIDFVRGWAIPVLTRSTKCHWYENSPSPLVTPICARVDEVHVSRLFGPGSYNRCGACIRAMSARIRTGRIT